MFFRTKILKDTPLVQLVEAFRNAEGQPRQRVVASLGDASIPEAEKKSIARAVEDRLGDQVDLLDDQLSPEAAVWVDRLYHTGDALFAKRKFIESALRDAQSGLFGSRGGIVLYDVTNTHFEGLCANNPKARHGKNKPPLRDSSRCPGANPPLRWKCAASPIRKIPAACWCFAAARCAARRNWR